MEKAKVEKRRGIGSYSSWLREPPHPQLTESPSQKRSYEMWLKQPAENPETVKVARTSSWRECQRDSGLATSTLSCSNSYSATASPCNSPTCPMHDDDCHQLMDDREASPVFDIVNVDQFDDHDGDSCDDVLTDESTHATGMTGTSTATASTADILIGCGSTDSTCSSIQHVHVDGRSDFESEEDNDEENHDQAEGSEGEVEHYDEEEDLESEDEHNTEYNDDSNPIYEGARISYGVHMLLIMAFIIRHGLSGAAILDLLTLIEIHCTSGNICQTSLRLFNKYFENGKTVLTHYVCDCGAYIGQDKGSRCRKCGSKSTGDHFLINPLSSALQSFFERPDFLSLLKYPQTRTKQNANNIEDVYDGNIYKERFADGYFTGTPPEVKSEEIHISLQMNTDGVSLFKSSKKSAWPVYFVINELHPKLRYSREYRILAGMWFSSKKPVFTTFLHPFAEMLHSLYHEGVKVKLPNGVTKTVKALLLSTCCDSPARCALQNFIQYNGHHGCSYCQQQGTSVRTSDTGSTWTYPYMYDETSGHGESRTHDQTLQYAEQAEATNKTICGVKGKSALFSFPRFDVIRCVPPDYMHGVMLGIMKLLMDLWFDVSNRCSKWSVRSAIKQVDQRLLSIRPPNVLSRPPQSIETNIKWWKASEFRSFLLFYSIPCLYSIMPSEYFEHFLLLVNSMHILLGNSISRESLLQAQKMLKLFVLKIKDLYHARYFTWNMHSLLHYVDSVEDLGPLFLFSCFWYEDFNGELRNLFHGTRGVSFQVLTAIAISQKIPTLTSQLMYGTLEWELYNHMSRKSNFKRIDINSTRFIFPSVSIVGTLSPLNKKFHAMVLRAIGFTTDMMAFKCIYFYNKLIQSREYDRVTKRSNFTVSFNYDSKILFGNIEVFIKCRKKCPNSTCCNPRCVCRKFFYGAIVEVVSPANGFCYDKNIVCVNRSTLHHVVPVKCADHVVVPITDIVSQCIFVDVGCDICFITHLPNSHEKD